MGRMTLQGMVVTIVTMVLLWAQCNGKKMLNKNEIILGYDFETHTDQSHITYGQQQTNLDSSIHKHGYKSLQWSWTVKQKLQFNLKPQQNKYTGKRAICGIHFWLHQSKPIETHLKVIFSNEKYQKDFTFRLNLNFQNWRAIARTFTGTNIQGIGATSITFIIEDNDPFNRNGQLNFDILRISNRCFGYGYDMVNTPQLLLPFNQRNEIGGIEDLNGVFDKSNFWQGFYKWRKVDQFHNKKINNLSPLTLEENRLTKELSRIEKRIDNWFFPEYKSTANLDELSLHKLNGLRNCEWHGIDKASKRFQKILLDKKYGHNSHIRTKTFQTGKSTRTVCIESAYEKYSKLSDEKTGEWPSLFASRDIYPHSLDNMTGLKFNQIIHHILLPMSLEYFNSKRHKQRQMALQQGSPSQENFDKLLSRELEFEPVELKSILQNPKEIQKIYRSIDNRRFSRFIKIFKHLIAQGWDDGSGLGNSDHLLNLNGGFTLSLYLLRKELRSYRIFNQLLNTARWYNEIGETQSKQYLHKGATADKIKGVMLGRLYTVLASPSDNIKQIRQKIHDMNNLKRWIENALEINDGYAGLLKPDYTGYHHKGPYMSAYIPHALHALSLVAYFLHGTTFAISPKYMNNLNNAVNTFSIISNNYEVPVGIAGAKIYNVESKALSDILPAVAYLTLANSNNSLGFSTDMANIFLQRYNPNDLLVRKYLVQGTPFSAAQYLNSVGSITIFEHVKQLAITNDLPKPSSTEGNWVFPYAALSIHKRDGWTVSVKGFSKYIWDYESLIDQNNYGRYQSHGQLQIITDKMKSSDVYDHLSGWDWNKIPGTTTMELSFQQLESHAKCRYFQPSTMVGGLSLRNRQGIFVMDFKQPVYDQNKHTLSLENRKSSFSFKKSYFFFDDMIICLGSNIHKQGENKNKIITTLFQNKLKGNAIAQMNRLKVRRGGLGVNITKSTNEPITFLDVSNNGYFIPASNGANVNFLVAKNKNGHTPTGLSIPKTRLKWYASAVLDHGVQPQNDKYEYAILVNSNEDQLELFKHRMSPTNLGVKPYTILRQDEIAHVVRFERDSTIYTGYTIFDHLKFFGDIDEHFIYHVDRPCVIMVKENQRYASVAVMDPDLRFFEKDLKTSKNIDENLLYNTKSKEAILQIQLNGRVQLSRRSRRKNKGKITNVFTRSNDFGDQKQTVNITLSQGRTIDIGFKKRNSY